MSGKKERIRGKANTTKVDEERWNILLSDYDTSKNEKELSSYAPHSNKKVWWICDKKHSYESSVHNRYVGSNCSYCTGRKVNETNCILATNPDVAGQWDYDKNKVEITSVIAGSNILYWWKCKNNHEWETSPNVRIKKGHGCPHCAGRTTADGNTLAEKFPEIAKEWHPTKNNDLDPEKITPKSDKKVWWICQDNPEHEYEAKIGNRTSIRKSGCPYCAGKKVNNTNSFSKLYPEIAKEWHPTKNEKTPDEYSRSSGHIVWWRCSKNHEWETQISNRLKGHSCPYCSGRFATENKNLAILFPKLLKEWDYSKNEKQPEEYTPASHSKVWWICSKNEKHTWYAKINNRTCGNKSNCPKCNMSKLEIETEGVLTSLNIKYETQKIFKNFKNHRFDFFLSELNTLIECDGEQHFNEDSKFYTARTNAKCFEEQKKSDKGKDEYCLENKHNLIRIAYTELGRIEKIIKYYLRLDTKEPKIYKFPVYEY